MQTFSSKWNMSIENTQNITVQERSSILEAAVYLERF